MWTPLVFEITNDGNDTRPCVIALLKQRRHSRREQHYTALEVHGPGIKHTWWYKCVFDRPTVPIHEFLRDCGKPQIYAYRTCDTSPKKIELATQFNTEFGRTIFCETEGDTDVIWCRKHSAFYKNCRQLHKPHLYRYYGARTKATPLTDNGTPQT